MEKAESRPMMKTVLAIAIFGITAAAYAETLSFPSFRIDVEEGWIHSLEKGPQAQNGWGELINIYHPDRDGKLKIQTYSAPKFVSRDVLRNMTNVDLSIPLAWHKWGDYFGYQYDYSEAGSFHRQWWLANEGTIIFVVYDSDSDSKGSEIDEMNKIIQSLKVNTT